MTKNYQAPQAEFIRLLAAEPLAYDSGWDVVGDTEVNIGVGGSGGTGGMPNASVTISTGEAGWDP